MAITVMQLAAHVLGREPENGADFEEADLPMMGGCESCAASVAAYNSCPSLSGYLRCNNCIGVFGFDTVEEAMAFAWPNNSHPRHPRAK